MFKGGIYVDYQARNSERFQKCPEVVPHATRNVRATLIGTVVTFRTRDQAGVLRGFLGDSIQSILAVNLWCGGNVFSDVWIKTSTAYIWWNEKC